MPPEGNSGSSTLATARAFTSLLVRQLRWRLAGAAALSVVLAFTEGAGLVMLVPLLQSIGLAAGSGGAGGLAGAAIAALAWVGLEPTLASILTVFVAITTAQALLYQASLLLHPALEQRFAQALRERLYAAVVQSDWSFFITRRTTDLLHAITAEVDRVSGSVYHMLTVLTGVATTTVYIAIAFRLSPFLTALIASTGVVVLWAVRRRTRRSGELGAGYSDADRRYFHMTSESISGLKIAKSLGAERRATEIYAAHARARAAAYLALMRSFTRAKTGLDIVSAVLLSGLLFVAVEALGLRGVELLVLVFLFARIMPRVMSLQNAAQVVRSGLASFNTVMQLIADGEAHAERIDDRSPGRISIHSDVRFDDVCFSYTRNASLVLRGITLGIPAGRTTAIVGSSGAGKSTLADILIGLLRPTSGRVEVDDRPLSETETAAWRRSVGYVPQDGFLLHDTVRANLLWANPDATEAELWAALERAAASAFVGARPERLDTVVGDRGVRLSGGERQRLALARALLTRPALLVLDEATSALDSVNEQLILDAVHELAGALTTVIITHRLAAIRHADIIHVLDEGRLVETGTWQDLAAAGGVFTKLLVAQGLDRAEVTAQLAVGPRL